MLLITSDNKWGLEEINESYLYYCLPPILLLVLWASSLFRIAECVFDLHISSMV